VLPLIGAGLDGEQGGEVCATASWNVKEAAVVQKRTRHEQALAQRFTAPMNE